MAEVKEEKKIGNYNGLLYQCSFIAEGKGVTSEKSGLLKVIKPGIRINLLRIALVNRTPKYPALFLEGIDSKEFTPLATPNGAPQINGLSNYEYTGTSLRGGFLYVINEVDAQGWSEWEIGLGGVLTEIDKSQKDDDVRIPNFGATQIDQYVAEPSDILWFAYSEVQWSASYFKTMRDDALQRGQRMQKYDLTKHVNNEPQQEYGGIWGSLEKKIVTIPENVLGYNTINRNKRIACIDETNNKQNYPLDAVLCLHDPVGILEELSSYLRYLWISMDSLLISMKTGITLQEAKKCLRTGKDPRKLQKPETLKQIEALHNIAVNIRGIAYANDKNRENFIESWWGIDEKRLNKVLALNDRLKIKAIF